MPKLLAFLTVLAMQVAVPPAGAQDPPPRPAGVAATGDSDGDKVVNSEDACPATPKPEKAVLRGCSVTELIASPAAALTPAGTALQDSTAGVSRIALVRSASGRGRAQLQAAAKRLTAAGLAGGRSGPCAAATAAGLAAEDATKGVTALNTVAKTFALRTRTTSRQWLLRKRAPSAALLRASDAVGEMSLARAGVVRAVNDARRAAAVLKTLCDKVGEAVKFDGTIKSVSGNRVLLADGTLLLLPRAHVDGPLVPGVHALGGGPKLKFSSASFGVQPVGSGNVVIATNVKTPPVVAATQCQGELMIAPPQDFTGSPLVYYPSAGWDTGGAVLDLETGTAFGARPTGVCGNTDTVQATVELQYKGGTRLLGVVDGQPAAPGAVLPGDVSSFKDAPKLIVKFQGLACKSIGPCVAQASLPTKEFPVLIRQAGTLAEAHYLRTDFTVPGPTAFDVGVLVSGGSVYPGTTVFGVGYPVKDNVDSFPSLGVITDGDRFSVRQSAGQLMGTGLLWAYAQGFRNGQPFYYTARLPKITTDNVARCSHAEAGETPPDASLMSHMLPWAKGKTHKVLAGPGDGAHKGPSAFAYSFEMDAGEDVLATRGGKVLWFDDSNADSAYATPNKMTIEHQDGTVSWYRGFAKGSIAVKVDQIIPRGRKLGRVAKATAPETSGGKTRYLYQNVSRLGPSDPLVYQKSTTSIFSTAGTDSAFLGTSTFGCVFEHAGASLTSTNTAS